jgi:hypothetical protein
MSLKGGVSMIKAEELLNENEKLKYRIHLLENEIGELKVELGKQLDLREKELVILSKQMENYQVMEKRYNNIRSSFFGRWIIRYWKLRKKIRAS